MPLEGYSGAKVYYNDVLIENMIHHAHVCRYIMSFGHKRVLIIGPGDHTVVDILRRRGLEVETLDIDPSLEPTYLADIKNLNLDRKFPCIAMNEVLEHQKIEALPGILDSINNILEEGGTFYISVPFNTIRLFPRKGFIISGQGRFNTQLPLYYWHDVLTPIRRIVRFFTGKKGEIRYIEDYAPDRFDVHHWDVGFRPTTRDYVRAIFQQKFDVIQEGVTPFNMPEAANVWNVVMRKKSLKQA